MSLVRADYSGVGLLKGTDRVDLCLFLRAIAPDLKRSLGGGGDVDLYLASIEDF
jgi:hypothetical protein